MPRYTLYRQRPCITPLNAFYTKLVHIGGDKVSHSWCVSVIHTQERNLFSFEAKAEKEKFAR
jgi:hypothetical protein